MDKYLYNTPMLTSMITGWLIGKRIASQRGPVPVIEKENLYFAFDQTALELNLMDNAAASSNGYYGYVPAAVSLDGDTLVVNE